MAKLTIDEAAEAVGKSRQTIWRATKNGTLSVEKNEHGVTVVDASELDRVYTINPAWLKKQAGETAEDDAQHETDATDETARNTSRNKALEGELKVLRERFDLAGQMHDERLKLLNTRIEELMQDRTDLRTERDRLLTTLQEQAISVKLLSNHSVMAPPKPEEPAPVPAAAVGGRRGLFGWIRR